MIGLESDEVNPKKSVGQRKGRMSNGRAAERRLMTKRTIITLMILMTDSLKSRGAKRIQKSVDQKKRENVHRDSSWREFAIAEDGVLSPPTFVVNALFLLQFIIMIFLIRY